MMRSDSLARELQKNNLNDFWKEIKTINNCKKSLPSNIDGVSGPDEISQLWRKQYYELLNCVKGNMFVVDSVDFNDDVIVTAAEVHEAILKLRDNKACGQDDITAEHVNLPVRNYTLWWLYVTQAFLFMECYQILCSLLC